MGFYSPATIVKDAQRHGLRVLPVDVMKSEWECTLEGAVSHQPSAVRHAIGRRSAVVGQNPMALRLGLRYVRGLHEEAGQAVARERKRAPFTSIHDLVRRAPELRKDELNTLAEIGALNSIQISPRRHGDTEINQSSHGFSPIHADQSKNKESTMTKNFSVSPCLSGEKVFHRRDALWGVAAAANPAGPLLEQIAESDNKSPLKIMTDEERLVADFRGTGMTVGPHPMSYHRTRMERMGVHRAIDLSQIPNGRKIRIAGGVIARQRPGTAKGFVFLSLEDETGVANAIVNPDLFQQNRLLLGTEQFLLIEGILQNQDGVISVKAARVAALKITRAHTVSHDFH
jgi:error-prone DNA polymerase